MLQYHYFLYIETNTWRKNALCSIPASHCPPCTSWFGTEICSSLFWASRQQGGKPCPLVRKRTALHECSYTGTFPASANALTNHSFTQSTPETSAVTGSGSKVVQQSSHRSPLQNLHPHFTLLIGYCNDLPEREQ